MRYLLLDPCARGPRRRSSGSGTATASPATSRPRRLARLGGSVTRSLAAHR